MRCSFGCDESWLWIEHAFNVVVDQGPYEMEFIAYGYNTHDYNTYGYNTHGYNTHGYNNPLSSDQCKQKATRNFTSFKTTSDITVI